MSLKKQDLPVISITGNVKDLRKILTFQKREMAFFSIDEKEIAVFPAVYEQYKNMIVEGQTISIIAKEDDNSVSVKYILESVN